MGIKPIEYSSWQGERTGILQRILVIIRKIFNQRVRSKGFLVLLIIGGILVHVFPILFGALSPHEELTRELMVRGGTFTGAYLKNDLFIIFSILLASVITSDLISSDLSDNSFVLYFSRPIKPFSYLTAKIGGAITTLSLFCLIPPVIFCITMIGTQSGSDYMASFEVFGITILAGILTSVYFVMVGVMLSSFTKRKAYAGVGTFMAFFVPVILSEFFANFDPNWKLLSPINILYYSYELMFGYELPTDIEPAYYYAAFFAIIFVPIIITYFRLNRRAKGK